MESQTNYILSLNNHYSAKIKDICAEYSYNIKKNTVKNISKPEDPVTLEKWFPVYFSGYYAVIGYNYITGDFIMSEPIIKVYSSQRIFESPRKYYILEGGCDKMTFEVYQCVYMSEYLPFFENFMKDFIIGLPQNWIESISQLNNFINMISRKDHPLHKRDNYLFTEILKPKSNCILSNISDYKELKFHLDEAYMQIKKNDKKWSGDLITKLRNNNKYDFLIQKLKVKTYNEMKRPEKSQPSKDYISLFLWLPYKDPNNGDFYISGFFQNKDKQIENFQSKIIYVHSRGIRIVTEKATIKLKGPICLSKYESLESSYIIKILTEKYTNSFFHGFPLEWQDMLSVIDMVLDVDRRDRDCIATSVSMQSVCDKSGDKENVQSINAGKRRGVKRRH